MNKWLLRLISSIVAVGLLVGCGANDQGEVLNNNVEQNQNNNETTENVEESITIIISKDNGDEIIQEKEIDIVEGDILLDIMKENLEIEEKDGFINAIEGNEQNEKENKYWMYTVNGEFASVGADQFELTPGDEVNFDLQSIE